jgi:hypothetical protein
MLEQSLQNCSATETDRTQRGIAREEDAFLIAAKDGDLVAFEVLYKQYASMLFHIARRMMRSKGRSTGVVSAGLHSSQELQRRFAIFNLAGPHCYQRRPDETCAESTSCEMCRWMDRSKTDGPVSGWRSKIRA